MLSQMDVFAHMEKLREATRQVSVDKPDAYNTIIERLPNWNIFFIGNGGSAAIASHMAIDYSKNGGFNAMAFNDASALTCLSNDYSYEDVFALQINKWAKQHDLVFAVSSSGESENIIRATQAALDKGCFVVTLSSFRPTNRLRSMGDINFYVAADEYGFAEISHLAILHSILDLSMREKQ